MKTYAIFLLFFIAAVGAANAATDTQIQMLDSRIESLIAQRDAMAAELRDCEKNVRGFKTAGIATLSATGIGIGVNIALAGKLAAAKSGGGGGKVDANRAPAPSVDENLRDICTEMGYPSPECDGL